MLIYELGPSLISNDLETSFRTNGTTYLTHDSCLL